MTEHTPIPWRAHDMETATIVAGRPGIAVADCNASSREEDENSANAALIVRAVNSHADMLSALEECEEYLDGRSDVVDGSYGEPAPNKAMSLLAEVRAAIRRAREG